MISRIAVLAAATVAIGAAPAAATTATLQQVITRKSHPSLTVCDHRYDVYQLSVARIGNRWDAVSSVTCAGATATSPNEISVYRLRSDGGVALIQRLGVGYYDRVRKRLTEPQSFTLSARTITIGYSIWSSTDSGCCPSHTGMRTFTWNGHGFTGSKMRIH